MLRDDVTMGDAADVLWMLASFECFDALFTGRGPPAEVLVTTAGCTLSG